MKKERDSNIELYRIVLMLLIVAHHYVVNSGVMDLIYNTPLSIKSIFLLIFGAWGKVGINCFLLITGYYMCKSNISLKKYVKLLFEIEFYRIIIFLILYLTNNTSFEMIGFIKMLLPVNAIKYNFSGCFLVFYLLIPFINILINNMKRKQHLSLIFVLLFFYSFMAHLLKIYEVAINYVSVYFIIYLIGSYIRLYKINLLENKKKCLSISFITMFIMIFSIILGAFICQKFNIKYIYYLFIDCNKLSAVIVSILIFYLFKNMKLKYNKYVNQIASSIFGVLLIHASSDAMREFLWVKLLNVKGVYNQSFIYVVLHAILSVLGIFIVCVIIDQLRIKFIEKPLFSKISTKLEEIELKIKKKVVD